MTVTIVHFLALVSPGPDFFLITRNSLIYSRRSGIYSSLGLALGILTHATYSLIGIGLIISESVILFSIMKFLAAGYLIYLGYKSLTGKSSHTSYGNRKQKDLTKLGALKMGYITNVTNPKAALFFVSLFTLIINPATPIWMKTIYGVWMMFTTFAWFAFVSIVFSHQIIKKRVDKIQHYVEKIMGLILITIGFTILLLSYE